MIIFIFEFIKNNIIPIATLFTSVSTFCILYLNYQESKPNISITQLENENSSVIIKPDRPTKEMPDVYWDSEYRVLSEVVITNKSSKPISIIEFKLNNTYFFNNYTKPGEKYEVTIKPGRTKLPSNVYSYGDSKTLIYPINEHWLQPVITIPPHVSIRGYLFFNIKDIENVWLGENILTTMTSRKEFSHKIMIFQKHETQILPEDQFVPAIDNG